MPSAWSSETRRREKSYLLWNCDNLVKAEDADTEASSPWVCALSRGSSATHSKVYLSRWNSKLKVFWHVTTLMFNTIMSTSNFLSWFRERPCRLHRLTSIFSLLLNSCKFHVYGELISYLCECSIECCFCIDLFVLCVLSSSSSSSLVVPLSMKRGRTDCLTNLAQSRLPPTPAEGRQLQIPKHT